MARNNIQLEDIPYLILLLILYLGLDWYLKKQFQKYSQKKNTYSVQLLKEYFPHAPSKELQKFADWYTLMFPKIHAFLPYYKVYKTHLYTAEAVVELDGIAKEYPHISTKELIHIYDQRRDIVKTLEEIIDFQTEK